MMRNNLIPAILLSAAALFGWAGAAQANLIIDPVPSTIDTWKVEPGQSIPTGTQGYVGGTLALNQAGLVTFSYGAGILAGDTGHGDSTFLNEFWVGANEAIARAAGDIFCTQTITDVCGASSVGDSFTIALPVGAIGFGFLYDQGNGTGGHTLVNGQRDDDNGAYLAQIGLGTANAGPGTLGYLGLSDNAYPLSDNDFQNMVVSVSVPEPGTMALLGLALAGLGFVRRRPH